ncbi:hypothetical protein GQR36_03955 [Enterococcus termitis]
MTIAHSEEIQSFVAPLNEDIEMKKRIWRLIQEEKYDEAVIDISNYIYTNVEQAVNEKGWAKIYEDSALARQEEQRLREKREIHIFLSLFQSVCLVSQYPFFIDNLFPIKRSGIFILTRYSQKNWKEMKAFAKKNLITG